MKKFFIYPVLFITTFFAVGFFVYMFPSSIPSLKGSLASIFFVESVSPKDIVKKYNKSRLGADPVNILIVPGHDYLSGGTEFQGVSEVSLNTTLAEYLTVLLREDPLLNVRLIRNSIGYDPNLLSYIDNNKESIQDFMSTKKERMRRLIAGGGVDSFVSVQHNTPPSDMVTKLYGINKWANDTNVDIVIHIHFNDYPRRSWSYGKYTGFSVYVPEKQFSNARASREIAESLVTEFSQFAAVSNYPPESQGVVEDQELIALGAFNTLDAAVVLIEYGYIYESRFTRPEIQYLTLQALAYQTRTGIRRFLNQDTLYIDKMKASAFDAFKWSANLSMGMGPNRDIFALQNVLAREGLYPPLFSTSRECPINGSFGPCTRRSVVEFQKKNNIYPPMGVVGPLTRGALNTER